MIDDPRAGKVCLRPKRAVPERAKGREGGRRREGRKVELTKVQEPSLGPLRSWNCSTNPTDEAFERSTASEEVKVDELALEERIDAGREDVRGQARSGGEVTDGSSTSLSKFNSERSSPL